MTGDIKIVSPDKSAFLFFFVGVLRAFGQLIVVTFFHAVEVVMSAKVINSVDISICVLSEVEGKTTT
jgi:hypothetical protein